MCSIILLEINMNSSFVRLNDTSQLTANLVNLARTVVKQFASVRGLSTTTKRIRKILLH